jgi:hypothetical protein
VRSLGKSPLLATVAILSLALGIGANTAVFTLLGQVVLRLLPVKNPEELALLTWRGSHYGSNTGSNALSYPLYADFRDQNRVFSGLICRYMLPLSVGAAIGRTITPEDDQRSGAQPVVVLSYGYWIERFGRDPGVIGKKLIVNGHTLTIIGVSEKGFDGTEVGFTSKMRIPVAMKKEMTTGWEVYNLENRRGRWVNVFGRLKPGVSLTQAKASLQPLFHSILEMEVQQKVDCTGSLLIWRMPVRTGARAMKRNWFGRGNPM